MSERYERGEEYFEDLAASLPGCSAAEYFALVEQDARRRLGSALFMKGWRIYSRAKGVMALIPESSVRSFQADLSGFWLHSRVGGDYPAVWEYYQRALGVECRHKEFSRGRSGLSYCEGCGREFGSLVEGRANDHR